jgi:hypothetical protein
MKTFDVTITMARPTENIVSYSRFVVFEYEGKTYEGAIVYDAYEGYSWEGDEDLPVSWSELDNFIEELDYLTCDKPECHGCLNRKERN